MNRITKNTLNDTLAMLNDLTKRQYGFYIAYGGYMLVDWVTNREITYRLTAREMYYTLLGIIHTLENENKGVK